MVHGGFAQRDLKMLNYNIKHLQAVGGALFRLI
jgi:hypothetical protein